MESRALVRPVCGLLRRSWRGIFTATERLQGGAAATSQQQPVNFGSEGIKPQPNPQAKQHEEEHPQAPQASEGAEGVKPKTIGDALEEAAAKGADKPLEMKDVRTIQSAEARATGAPAGVLGGPAQYAANLKDGRGPGANIENPTLGDALKDAKQYMPFDKVVTERDAQRVEQAEQRNDPLGRVDPQGVAAAVKEAADYNIAHGVVPSSGGGQEVPPGVASRVPGAGGAGRG